jgi:hypothetical protein
MAQHVYRRPPDPLQRFRLATVPVLFSESPGVISGTATITIGETAAPSAYASTAGSATITYSETATIQGITSLSASTTLTFSESAALDAFRFGDMSAAESIIFSEVAKLSDASTDLPQPVLPVLKPSFRSIDAKTLADHFNRGQPEMADYDWPNRRRFYQDDSPA